MGTIRTALTAALTRSRAATGAHDVPYVPLPAQHASLPYEIVVPAAAERPGFVLSSPVAPRLLALTGERFEVAVDLSRPGAFGAFLTNNGWPGTSDPVSAVRQIRLRKGPVRRTTVAGMPAAFADVRFPLRRRIVREYRFLHEGVVFGAGVVGRLGDDEVQRVGLAMLQTWTWTG